MRKFKDGKTRVKEGLKRYQCKDCKNWFSLDHRKKMGQSVLLDHVDGKPLRKIADKVKSSKSKVARKYQEELKKVPNSNEITQKYCTRFCGILVVDGKYIPVKGYERKIPLLWGIDYLTHDIPSICGALAQCIHPSKKV